ncbi:MAG: DcaP family trimeric outer membrane transporter [Odoribacter sp.]
MRKKLALTLFTLFALSYCFDAQAQKVNVTSVSKVNDTHNFYTMMKEAFPLAYNDPAAPRFIFYDNNKNFIFGIGGFIQATGVYDFNGVEDYNYFTTSSIALKGKQGGASYGLTLGQSRLFFKLIGNTDVGKLVSYLEMEFEGPQNSPVLRQAFIQFRGFLIGQAWSTFGDMSAVPTTIDEEGPSSGIETRQPMVRYTHSFNKRWQAALALEYVIPSYSTGDYTNVIRQKVPDIPLNVRYTMHNGSHLQASGILRNISYQDKLNDKDKIATGWGASLSGQINLCKKTSFMFQGVYGKGIANYIQDISGNGYDLIPNAHENGKLESAGMWGAFCAFQQNWTPNLYSSLIYSYARLENRSNLAGTTYKYAQYGAANLLWNFTEYGTTGIEYIFGRRNDFNKEYGNANRINAMVQYRF